jgi:hypothetical protein
MTTYPKYKRQDEVTCSFCGVSVDASPDQNRRKPQVVAGPEVFICRGCVAMCVEIMGEDPEWREGRIADLTRLRGRIRGKLASSAARLAAWLRS